MLTPEQLEIRSRGITGSEIAAIAGLSPYDGPLEVWAKKLGLVEDENSAVMDRGTYLERGIRDWYCAKTGATVTDVGTVVHPSHPLVIATPDGIADLGNGNVRGLEIKAPTWRTFRNWGYEGTDNIPEWYIPQCTWEAAVLGIPLVDVAADLGDHLGIWTVKFDEELFGRLREIAEKFWRDYVVTKVAPPAQGFPHEAETLKKVFPRANTDEYLEADDDLSALVSEYRFAKAKRDEYGRIFETYENRLRQAIGDKAGIRGDFGRVDYKNNKPWLVINWQAIARELKADAELIARHITVKPGARPLRGYFKKG